MKQRRVAAPYAKALFAVEKEHNQTELVGRELGHMAATFESDLALRDFVARPQRSGLSTHTRDVVALSRRSPRSLRGS